MFVLAAEFLFGFSSFARAQESLRSVPPNIVIILADDLGIGDPGCYNAKSKIPTPELDRLATEGMRFTDAHSPSSVCTPTRYGLLTGRYCWRTPLKKSVLWPWDPPLIEKDRLTLGKMLQDSGYRTACVGKWHLGWDWPIGADASEAIPQGGNWLSDRQLDRSEKNPQDEGPIYLTKRFRGHTIAGNHRAAIGRSIDWVAPIAGGPLTRGFDEYYGDDVPNFPPYGFIRNDRVERVPDAEKPAAMFGHAGPALSDWDLSGVMPAITKEAVAFIERQGDAGGKTSKAAHKPFFLYFALTAPHTPIAPTEEYTGASQAGRYGDFVHQVDASVGAVLKALDRAGLRDNTLVIFTSDNGSPQRDGTNMSGATGSVKKFGHDPSFPFRGMKSDIWEAGHRVPFLVRWPGKVQAGVVSDEPMIHTDIFRTLALVVGSEIPRGAGEDSFDMSSVWFASHAQDRDENETRARVRDHLIHHSGQGLFAIRQGDWKLILGKGSGGFTRFKPAADAPAGQLYNLQLDPGELDNVYADHPDVVQRLSAKLKMIQAQPSSTLLPLGLSGTSPSR